MDFRNEIKFEVSAGDMTAIRSRLQAVMRLDEHAVDGRYLIRSLYFDTPSDKALMEKLNGVNVREKFRLRYYNNDLSLIHLEKKSKINGLCNKQTATIDKAAVQDILSGNLSHLLDHDEPLVQELYAKMSNSLLMPKTIVEYLREPYIFAPGNVRVTLDYNLRTGIGCSEFLKPDCAILPVWNAPIILEVKWDEYLPLVIKDAIQLDNRRSGAFSKYAACRIYG